MKRGSVGSTNEKQIAKKPKTNTEIAQKLLGNIQQIMMKHLTQGKVIVNSSSKPLPSPKKSQNHHFSNPQQYLQNIQTSLKTLRQSIQQTKRIQKEQEKVKNIKAKELIDRMKKEKEEHQLKIREQSQKSILSSRIYSQTTINKMRQKLEERISQKKRDIEERVRSIEQRKKVRDEQHVNQQIQYWQKLKGIKQKAKSTPKLPRIGSLDLSSKQNSSSSIRKNTSFITSSEQSKPQQSEKGLQHYLKIAKSRQQHIKLKLAEQRNESRLQKIISSNSNLASRLHSHPSRVVELIPYNANRHKLMGDEFLKESLLLIKKSQAALAVQPQQTSQKQVIQVKAHQALISKNIKIQQMRQKWQRTLSKIQHNQISIQQGLDLLNNIQKRLDKIDFNGIKQRLANKYRIFEAIPQFLNNHNKIQVIADTQTKG